MRPVVCLLLSVVTLGLSREVDACGQTPFLLEALMPLAGASDVPLNAALITSSNEATAEIWLRKTDTVGLPDGAADVPVATECEVAFYGAVCVARPVAWLEPNTHYSWRAVMTSAEGYEVAGFSPLEWREFTTGDQVDVAPPEVETVSLEIVSDRIYSQAPCGLDRAVELDFGMGALTEPVVLNFAGFTPSYVMQATLLTPELMTVRTTLYSPPDCLSPVAFDQVGRRLPLASLCLSAVSDPERFGPDGEPEVSETSCALSARPSSSTAGIALLLAVLAGRCIRNSPRRRRGGR